MIHYQLICGCEHVFDGWFKDSAGFDRQCAAGLVTCPACGDSAVNRALMAPSIARRRAPVDPSGTVAPVTVPTVPAPAMAAAALPDQLRSMFQRLRAEVEKTCEDVGDRFADEARAIHHGQSDQRGIYGQTTLEQAEALADEGIDIARIPWVPRADG